MIERDLKILDAAIMVFSRYGVRRATMGDIATQSGVSRQTLYGAFANKEAIIEAAIEVMWAKTREAIRTGWEQEKSLAGRLDIFFAHAVTTPYEILKQMPDSNDLLTGASDGWDEIYRDKGELLETLFCEHAKPLKQNDETPQTIADFVMHSSSNMKYVAKDREHLDRLLASLKRSVLALADN